ncbi:hypothetical protein Ptr902_10458 [Pyrenophora tritici-repentis]|nr:hypothetical protein L13192_10094 [Pyrenophora tritici-repentis]KAI2478263.1 hypothetical protein Ptr902_10458 [Pyrenophora tritici-repentis]
MNLPTVRQKYEAITTRYREQGVTEESNFTDKFKAGLFILAINNAYPDYGRDRRTDLRRNVTLNVDRMCSELIDEARRDDLIKTINTSIRASREAPPVAAAIEAIGEPSADEVEVLRVRLRDLQIPPYTASTATATILEEVITASTPFLTSPLKPSVSAKLNNKITVVTLEGVLNKVSFTNVLYALDMFVLVLSHFKLRAKNLYYHGWDSKLYLMLSQQEIAFTPKIDKIPTLLLANTELEAARAFAFTTAATTNLIGVLAPYREITL